VKWTLGIIGIIAAGLLVWAFREGGPTGLTMIVAIASVVVFGSVPVVLGARSRARVRAATHQERIVVIHTEANARDGEPPTSDRV